jgi:deazaflavin-dependent oxidoreductase (nitroreductase family)
LREIVEPKSQSDQATDSVMADGRASRVADRRLRRVVEMGRRVRAGIAAAGLVVTAVMATFVVGLRRKYPPVVNTIRRFARDVGNPRLLKYAGKPGANASIMRHVGRTSGRQYETPVTAVPTADGFVIALPYGPNTDWLKNVLAAGSATLVHDGQDHPVDRPEVVPSAQAAGDFSPRERRTLRWFGVEECLRLHRGDPDEAGE